MVRIHGPGSIERAMIGGHPPFVGAEYGWPFPCFLRESWDIVGLPLDRAWIV